MTDVSSGHDKDVTGGMTDVSSGATKNVIANKESRELERVEKVETPAAQTGASSSGKNLSPKRRSTPQTSLPENYQLTDDLRKWAAAKGYDRLDERLEYFVGLAKAKGYRYADWNQAFQNSVRLDWANLNERNRNHASKAERRQNNNLAARETVRASIMAGG